MPKTLGTLPTTTDIVGLKIRVPEELRIHNNIPKSEMYIRSGWNKGLWLKEDKNHDGRIYPLTFQEFADIADIEVIDGTE